MSPRKSTEVVQDAMSQAKTAHQELQGLRKKVKHQRLILMALWQIVKEEHSWTDEQLLEVMNGIEKQEREAEPEAIACPECSRPLQENSTVCIYCGATVGQHSLF